MRVKVTSVSKELPPYFRTTEEIIPMLENWLHGQEKRLIRKAVKIFENAGVDKRYSIMDPLEVFSNPSFGSRNDIYQHEIIKLGEKALKKALEDAGWEPETIDVIITVSCTGIMIPSVDAYLINSLHLKQDIIRLPVTEMGCAAGISAMIYAENFLRANPGKRAAVLALEAPTATFQLEDFSMTNIVSTAIFGDGAACVLLSSKKEDTGAEILDRSMYHFYNTTHLMGFKLVDTGLQMILDIDVPDEIAAHFPDIIHPFLKKNNLTVSEVDHLIFHPGGKKIVQTVEDLFGKFGKNIDDTKEVLRLYGNMSSVTVLYVLERFFRKNIPAGDLGLMLSFGPGFSAQRILLQF